MNRFRCQLCGEGFRTEVTDEEARADLEATFVKTEGECVKLCEDCYKRLMVWVRENYPDELRGGGKVQ